MATLGRGPRCRPRRVVGAEWIDDGGRRARDRLRAGESDAVIGHCHWLASNLRWSGDVLLVVHDWDSAIVERSRPGRLRRRAVFDRQRGRASHHEETEWFLDMYCHARGRGFSASELERAWAAGAWTRAYDAKYQHTVGLPVTSLSEDDAR